MKTDPDGVELKQHRHNSLMLRLLWLVLLPCIIFTICILLFTFDVPEATMVLSMGFTVIGGFAAIVATMGSFAKDFNSIL